MFEFAWFWVWLVLPLPWLIWRYCPPRARLAEAGLRVPDLRDFTAVEASGSPAPPRATRLLWPLLAWLLLVAAAANPRWLGEPVGVTASGRDLMLVLDLSQSMEVKDFILKDNAVDRLTALKSVASDFIRRREGDREPVAPGRHPATGRHKGEGCGHLPGRRPRSYGRRGEQGAHRRDSKAGQRKQRRAQEKRSHRGRLREMGNVAALPTAPAG